MLRDDSCRGPESVDSLQRFVVEYETAWLAYLSATEEWKQASDAYAAAHGQLATRTRTQTDAPA